MKIDRLIKIIASICFVLITVALVVVWNSPATGYEVSIYSATPPIVWSILFVNVACGIGIVVQQIYNKKYRTSSLWVIGLLLILLSYTMLLSLHIIRNYAIYGIGDVAFHLEQSIDIISTGYFGKELSYPITHIYLAVISSISGIPPIVLHKYIPLLFGLLFVAFMYLLAKAILPDKGQVILATVGSTALLHGWYLLFAPNLLANLAFPLALFLLIKSFTSGTVRWKALFIIMVFLFPVFHPVPGFILLLVLLTIWLPGRILGFLRKEPLKATGIAFGFNTTATLLLFVWGITWLSGFYVWEATIRNIYTVITEGGPVHIGILREQILLAEGYGYSVAEQFFKVYGGIMVLILLTMAALPILWRRMSAEANLRNLFSLYAPLAAFALAIIVLFLFALPFSPSRLVVYLVIICTIFTGFMLYEIIEKTRSSHHSSYLSKLAPLLVTVLLLGVFVNGALKLYPSPYTLQPNWQVTRNSLVGMKWFFNTKDTAIGVSSITISPLWFARVVLEPNQAWPDIGIPRHTELPPYHFNYTERPTLGTSFITDRYLILHTLDRLLYVEVFPEIQHLRYSPSEFEKLEQDPSVSKLYSNGGLDVYFIHARTSPT